MVLVGRGVLPASFAALGAGTLDGVAEGLGPVRLVKCGPVGGAGLIRLVKCGPLDAALGTLVGAVRGGERDGGAESSFHTPVLHNGAAGSELPAVGPPEAAADFASNTPSRSSTLFFGDLDRCLFSPRHDLDLDLRRAWCSESWVLPCCGRVSLYRSEALRPWWSLPWWRSLC